MPGFVTRTAEVASPVCRTLMIKREAVLVAFGPLCMSRF
jgi:hypothetical protein